MMTVRNLDGIVPAQVDRPKHMSVATSFTIALR